MKFRFALLLGILLLPVINVFAVDAGDLQGKWVITAVNGEDDGDRSEVWEFRGDQWIAWSSGRALAPDTFTMTGDVIDLGYARIKILEVSGNRMRTEQMGFTYTLERQ